MSTPLMALWLLTLGLVVFGLPWLDIRDQARRDRALEMGMLTIPVLPELAPPDVAGRFPEEDPLYRAVRSGLPMATDDEHEVALEIVRRVRYLAPPS